MSDETDILNPVRELKISGVVIQVKELRWSEALQLFKKISAHVGKVFTIKDDGSVRTNLSAESIGEIITGSDDIATFLVEKSTGKDAAWFNGLSISQSLEVLNTAVELNLSEQIIKKATALGQRFSGVVPGARAAVSAKPTPS